MRTTRRDTDSFLKDPTSLLSGHLVLPEDTVSDLAYQPWTGFVRAVASASSEGNVASVESAFIDENLDDFEDLPDLEKLLDRTNLSDLEDLPDLEELLDLEESDSAGTFLPATKSECRSPQAVTSSTVSILKKRIFT